ncbi:hypothetical protein KEM52_001090, partial [Ascosphaera acerosa]
QQRRRVPLLRDAGSLLLRHVLPRHLRRRPQEGRRHPLPDPLRDRPGSLLPAMPRARREAQVQEAQPDPLHLPACAAGPRVEDVRVGRDERDLHERHAEQDQEQDQQVRLLRRAGHRRAAAPAGRQQQGRRVVPVPHLLHGGRRRAGAHQEGVRERRDADGRAQSAVHQGGAGIRQGVPGAAGPGYGRAGLGVHDGAPAVVPGGWLGGCEAV